MRCVVKGANGEVGGEFKEDFIGLNLIPSKVCDVKLRHISR